jgi:UDP-N-acetylglucosamine:LPS N-acetylglucosamine transferase
MGLLYAQSDMAIVRGGTTTLAECKIFDLPLAIVPLPVTHDQAKNAQYYVEKYQDICISQNNHNFIDILYNVIIHTKKKEHIFDVNKTKIIIQQSKTIILDMMLLS